MSLAKRLALALVSFVVLTVTGPELDLLRWMDGSESSKAQAVTLAVVAAEFHAQWLIYLVARPEPEVGERWALPLVSWLIWLFVGYATLPLAGVIHEGTWFDGLVGLYFFIHLPWFAAQYFVLLVVWGWLADRARNAGTVVPSQLPPSEDDPW